VARARVCAIALLLEEEHTSAAAALEATAVALQWFSYAIEGVGPLMLWSNSAESLPLVSACRSLVIE
jgi:hypothetical protein